MDADTANTHARRRWGIAVACIIGGVAAVGGIVWWFTPESEPATRLGTVRVAGFEKVATEGSTDAVPSAAALFVGPSVDDVSRIISAPGLTVTLLPPRAPSPPRPDPLPGERAYVWAPIAAGRWSNGCALEIRREFETPYHEEKLTKAQIAGMKDGSVYLLRMTATCGER
ncbi:hypothetical protein [Nocardia sp. NPDC050175]|uniref:hypothetical protein n=1 Tax=Nocardia sp. NPDC050175 TaxID=3364317 RepID=UPI0037B6E0C5